MARLLELLGRSLKSLRLTAGIIAALIVLYFLGLVIPQKWMFAGRAEYAHWLGQGALNRILDVTGFTDIYFAPLTLVLLAVFFVNLVVIMAARVPAMLQRAYLRGGPPVFTVQEVRESGLFHEIHSPNAPDAALEVLRKFFRSRRWTVVGGSERGFLAVKNRLSPVGFFLFHLSFLLCLLGGLMIYSTRFVGNLVLTEGQAFENDIRQFRRIFREPHFGKELPSLTIVLQEIKPFYDQDKPSQLEALLQVRSGSEVTEQRLKVNEPFERGPLTIIVENIGVSPLFEILSRTGTVIDGAFISLNVLKGDEDTFQFDSLPGYRFRVRFFPDYHVHNGIETTRSQELRNPAVRLAIEKGDMQLYAGTIKIGSEADAGPFRVRIPDVRYWADLKVVREYGSTPLVAGFLLGAIGLIMRLIFYQKRLRVAVEVRDHGALIIIDGKSEQFPDAFAEEFRRMMEIIDASFAGSTP